MVAHHRQNLGANFFDLSRQGRKRMWRETYMFDCWCAGSTATKWRASSAGRRRWRPSSRPASTSTSSTTTSSRLRRASPSATSSPSERATQVSSSTQIAPDRHPLDLSLTFNATSVWRFEADCVRESEQACTPATAALKSKSETKS